MASAIRLHLFYGNDSYTSLQALRRWTALFDTKYGTTTRHILEVDELSVAQLQTALSRILSTNSLFPEPVLLILKRISSLSAAQSRECMQILTKQVTNMADSTTILVWEDQGLPPTHAVLTQFEEWAAGGRAKLHLSMMPAERDLIRVAQRLLEPLGCSLDPDGARWLREQYRFQDQQVRLASRKKAADILLEDTRSWWLPRILEGAALRSLEGVVTATQLAEGQRSLAQPVSAFEIAQACTNRQWEVLRERLYVFGQGADTSSFFGLLGALRWQLQRGSSTLSPSLQAYAMRILNELELILKNFPLEAPWLFDVFVFRLQEADWSGARAEIIPARTLWLCQLPRS